MITKDTPVPEAISEVFGGQYEPVSKECEWCAREVSVIDLSYCSLTDDPILPGNLLRICPECHPDHG